MNKIKHNTQTSPKPTLQVGQFYLHKNGGTYLLAAVSFASYALICLEEGNRRCNPVTTIDEVFGKNRRDEFTLITNPFTVTPQP